MKSESFFDQKPDALSSRRLLEEAASRRILEVNKSQDKLHHKIPFGQAEIDVKVKPNQKRLNFDAKEQKRREMMAKLKVHKSIMLEADDPNHNFKHKLQ